MVKEFERSTTTTLSHIVWEPWNFAVELFRLPRYLPCCIYTRLSEMVVVIEKLVFDSTFTVVYPQLTNMARVHSSSTAKSLPSVLPFRL